MDIYAAALAAGVVAVALVAAVVIAVRRRGTRCPTCGRRLSRGVADCPACIAPLPAKVATDKETPEQPAPPAELVAVQGPLAPQRFPIPAQGLSLGRHSDNDLVLAGEPMVSRHHAVVVVEQGQHVLYDRDSINGTWVNGQRIFRHRLAPGDRIQLWQSLFLFAAPDVPAPAPPPTAAPAPALHAVGDYFAGYALEGLIGRGGMSEVFKARDRSGRWVAIKILQQTDPYLVAKFVQEGNQVGPLLRGHPNIVYVYEFGQSQDNHLYIVMEYVEAPPLRKAVQYPLEERETVKIVGQVCNALAFAHHNGIVHRDLKPENILFTADGVAKVLDFGIAKLTSAATVTRDKIVGTPEYISPEQARGDPVCPASDVYSLGIVLYELLTGSVPFRQPTDENLYRAALKVVHQHLQERPEPLRKRNPAVRVSDRLERVTLRALAKNVKDRYPTAREMGEALGFDRWTEVPAAPPRPARAGLSVLHGPQQGQWIELTDGCLSLGRLALDPSDRTISRQHANVVWRGDGYWLQDTSTNGTWVDEQRVYGEVPLRAGVVIRLGNSALRLEVE